MARNFMDLDLSKHSAAEDDSGGAQESAIDRLAKQKDDIANKVANAAEEIERLRMRQEELEYAKKALLELNRKQDDYDRSKKEIIANLARSVLQMEKDEVRAGRMVELLSATRGQFKDLLAEIREIREERWEESRFEEELDRSLALLENARMVFNKSIAKIDAESWQKGDRPSTALAVPRDAGSQVLLADNGFFFWLKVGMALTFPVLLVLLAAAGVFVWFVAP